MSKIIVIGSLNMDLVINTPKLPVMGETVLGGGFMTAPGGKGANQAVAAARLGGEVYMVGCVGDDIFGKELAGNLLSNSVKSNHVYEIKGTPTGAAVIVLYKGDNFIVLDSGANACLDEEKLKLCEELIDNNAIVILQLEIPIDTVTKAIELAKRKGAKVLLNPAPAVSLSDDLLSNLDILVLNETECELITGIKIESIDKAKEAVKYIMEKGIPQVVITLGGNGAAYNSGKELIHMPIPNVKIEVVDTTAAGDSFIGAMTVALSNGKNIDEAIKFAGIVASITVSRKGAQTSLPSLKDVDEFCRKNMRTNCNEQIN
jgi:ribokinase